MKLGNRTLTDSDVEPVWIFWREFLEVTSLDEIRVLLSIYRYLWKVNLVRVLQIVSVSNNETVCWDIFNSDGIL